MKWKKRAFIANTQMEEKSKQKKIWEEDIGL